MGKVGGGMRGNAASDEPERKHVCTRAAQNDSIEESLIERDRRSPLAPEKYEEARQLTITKGMARPCQTSNSFRLLRLEY